MPEGMGEPVGVRGSSPQRAGGIWASAHINERRSAGGRFCIWGPLNSVGCRALPCGGRGRGFESHQARHYSQRPGGKLLSRQTRPDSAKRTPHNTALNQPLTSPRDLLNQGNRIWTQIAQRFPRTRGAIPSSAGAPPRCRPDRIRTGKYRRRVTPSACPVRPEYPRPGPRSRPLIAPCPSLQ